MNDLERIQKWQSATRRDWHPIEDEAEYIASGQFYWETYLSKHVRPLDRALELGCGDGRIARHVQCHELFVTDVSVPAIEATQANVPDAKVFRFDRQVDVMYAINVFIHLSHSMIESTLFFMARYAKRFAIQMPLYDVAREGCDWIDVTTATPIQWITWCDKAGLDVVELHASKGEFSWDRIGPAHHALQICEARQ